jgi:hypothetical protein
LAKQKTLYRRATQAQQRTGPPFYFDHSRLETAMHTSTLLAILGAAALSAPAFAAPAAVTAQAGGTAMAVQTVAGQRHTLRPGEVGDVVGNYVLSDGSTLRVSYAQRRLFAELGSSRAELVPAGPRTFVSSDDGMTLVFDQLPFTTGVAVTRR